MILLSILARHPLGSQEDLERHVAALAAMPRPNLLEAAAAAAAVHEQQRQTSYPKTLFDDPADLALFPDPDALITPKGARKRWRIPKDPAVAALEAAVAAEAARAAKTEAAVEAARAAEAEASGEEARPPGKRRLVDASGSLPAVLRAVSEALPGALRAKTLDKSVEASLRRALSRADPDARMRTRQEDGEKKAATLLLITAERAGPMTTFLSEVRPGGQMAGGGWWIVPARRSCGRAGPGRLIARAGGAAGRGQRAEQPLATGPPLHAHSTAPLQTKSRHPPSSNS